MATATTIAIEEANPRIQYTATAAQVNFDFPYPVYEAEHVQVYLTPAGQEYSEVDDILILTTDYTVTQTYDQSGALITLVSGANSGDIITILRVVPVERINDYQKAGSFKAESVNRELDLFTMILQQQAGEIGRSVKLSPLGSVQEVEIPQPESGLILRWTSGGTLENVAPASFGAIIIRDYSRVFDNLADFVADTALDIGDSVIVLGRLSPGDGGGNQYKVRAAGTGVVDGGKWINLTGSGHQAEGIFPGGFCNVKQFGAVGDGVSGDAGAISNSLAAYPLCYAPPGTYRLNGPIRLISDVKLFGVKGESILLQYGEAAFEQIESDMENIHICGMTLDFQSSSTSRYHVAFRLGAYRKSIIENIEFIRYDDQTILERTPASDATFNGTDNVHRDWHISACAHIDIAIGLEGYYYMHQGDGITTSIPTGVSWPEQFNSSVVVLKENSNRIFSQMTLGADYTTSFPGGALTINLTSPALSDERIHIWPAQPRTDGNRRPYSNNLWENIRAQYVFIRGHTAVRWVDAETHRFERIILASDSARAYVTNPYLERTGQGGDYARYDDCVVSYQGVSFVPNPNTLWAFSFGPGSNNMAGTAVRMDLLWKHSGVNRSITHTDGRAVTLTGTVSVTTGSPVVTGVGTVFLQQLTLIGAVADQVVIDGNTYGISSIDSNLQITMSTNSLTTSAGVPISRLNIENATSYDMHFASNGGGYTVASSKTMARHLLNHATKQKGSAVILSGNTAVTVSHNASRVPRVGEIQVTSHSVTGGRSHSVSNITASTFNINVSSAAGADYTFGWQIELQELN